MPIARLISVAREAIGDCEGGALVEAALRQIAVEGAGAGERVAAFASAPSAGAGLSVARALARNHAFPLLSRLGALVHTGATGTNLLDLHLLARTPR